MKYYVYEMIDPRTDKVFYVGKGQKERMYEHEKDVQKGKIPNKTNKRLENKIKKIMVTNLKIKYKKIFETNIETEAYDKEKDLIAKISLNNLCNLSNGGDCGPSAKGLKRSEETKRKMSEASKGQIPWNKEKTGFKCSEETKKKISKSLEGNIISKETRRKISKSLSGKNHPQFGKPRLEETKQKISKTLISYNKRKPQEVK